MRILGESAVIVRLEQEDKHKQSAERLKELENDVQQLQRDILDQDAINKE